MRSQFFIRRRATTYKTLAGALLLLLPLFAGGCAADDGRPAAPPPNYAPMAEVDLSARAYDRETLGRVALEEATEVGIFYALPNVATPYFELSLSGPDGAGLVILRSEEFRTDQNGGGSWEAQLSPGTYALLLSSEQGAGTLSVYWATR